MGESLTLAQAQQVLWGALDAAGTQGVSVAAVVTDLGGHVVAAARMDGVGFVNIEVARRKATAAATFQAPTREVAAMTDDPLLAGALFAVSDVLVLPGGFPLRAGGACVGGLGVAGGHYTQDHAVGEAAMAVAAPR